MKLQCQKVDRYNWLQEQDILSSKLQVSADDCYCLDYLQELLHFKNKLAVDIFHV